MSAAWPLTKLAEVIQPSLDPHTVDASCSYANLGIYSFGRGVFAKAPIEGANTSATTLYRVRGGQFIYSRLFAFEGAYATVPPELDGAYVSNEFPTFDCDPRRVDPRFLQWLFKRPSVWSEIAARSTGMGDRRQRIHPDQVVEHKILLPPLEEQRRIVARIEELAAKVEEARRLRRGLDSEIRSLPRAILASDKSGRQIRVGQFASLRAPDVSVVPTEQYHFAGVYSFGRGVFPSVRKMGSEFAYPRLTRLRARNFVYPKLMAWEGALGMVPSNCDQLVVSTEFPVFEIDEKVMLPEVVDIYFRSPEVWPQLSGQSGGTNVRRRRLNPQDFLNLEMPWPSEVTQRVIRDTVERLSGIADLQTETSAELDAMLPAILDKAFKGEL